MHAMRQGYPCHVVKLRAPLLSFSLSYKGTFCDARLFSKVQSPSVEELASVDRAALHPVTRPDQEAQPSQDERGFRTKRHDETVVQKKFCMSARGMLENKTERQSV